MGRHAGTGKTASEIINRLHAAMIKALAKAEVKAQLEKLGAVIIGDTPAQFTAYLLRDYKRWADVIKAAQIKANKGCQS